MDALRQIRLQKGWSQQDLAAVSGVGQDTISGIESGRHEPRPSTLRKLASALGVQVAEFFREPALPKGDAPPSPVAPEEDAGEERRIQEAERLEEWRARDFIERFPQEEERRKYLQDYVQRIYAHYPNLYGNLLNAVKDTNTDVLGLATMYAVFTRDLENTLQERGIIAYLNSVLQEKVEASHREREFCKQFAQSISTKLASLARIAEDARELARQQHKAAKEAELVAQEFEEREFEAYMAGGTDSGGGRSNAPTESQ